MVVKKGLCSSNDIKTCIIRVYCSTPAKSTLKQSTEPSSSSALNSSDSIKTSLNKAIY